MTNTYNENTLVIRANEISEMMGVSMTYAYRIIKQLNNELSERGYLIVQGRTNRKYFYERIYGKAV